jgi:hypothetical protein
MVQVKAPSLVPSILATFNELIIDSFVEEPVNVNSADVLTSAL